MYMMTHGMAQAAARVCVCTHVCVPQNGRRPAQISAHQPDVRDTLTASKLAEFISVPVQLITLQQTGWY